MTESKPRVFISFNTSADQDRAQALKSALEAEHAFSEVFEYTQQPKGIEYRPATNDKIKNADSFIVLLSNASMESEEVQLECDVAKASERDRGRPTIVPVFIKEKPTINSYEQATLYWLLKRNGVVWTDQKSAEAVAQELRPSRLCQTAPSVSSSDPETEVVFRIRQNDRFLHIVQVENHTDRFEAVNVSELHTSISQIRRALDQLCKKYLENLPGHRTDALVELESARDGWLSPEEEDLWKTDQSR